MGKALALGRIGLTQPYGLDQGGFVPTADETDQNRAIITVLGHDRPGIVAAVSTELSERSANILDISQTILQGTFTMTMLVDLAQVKTDFSELKGALDALSERLGVQIRIQREEVFRYMYRL